jgi:hypothetical protein
MHAAAWLAVVTLAQGPWSFGAAVEPARESLRYRFENPSSFDTVDLVPHFFIQTYDTDHVWLTLLARHPLFGRRSETLVSLTPTDTRQADDFDTFLQPDGDVVVSGTTGNASQRGWSVEERVTTGRYRGADMGLVFRFRRDTARYHEGTRIVTTTQPPTHTESLVTTQEFVTSEMFDVGLSATVVRGVGTASLQATPVGAARLSIELPDKYPGKTLVATARYSSLTGEASVNRKVGTLNARVGARLARVFGWRHSASVRLSRASLFLELSTN